MKLLIEILIFLLSLLSPEKKEKPDWDKIAKQASKATNEYFKNKQ